MKKPFNHLLLVSSCAFLIGLSSCEKITFPVEGVPTGKAARRVYYSDFNQMQIVRTDMNLADGTVVSTPLFDAADGVMGPAGLALDITNHYIYWTDALNQTIMRGNLDGSGKPVCIYDHADGLVNPTEITLDVAKGKIYWSDQQTSEIYQGSVDGKSKPKLLYDSKDGVNGSYGIAMSVIEGKLFWAEFADKEILSGNTEGAGAPSVLFNESDGLERPFDVAVDLINQKLYMVDNPQPVDSTDSDRILVGNLNGSGSLTTLYEGVGDNIDNCFSIALDLTGRKIYWLNQLESGQIARGDLDGAFASQIVADSVTTGINLTLE